MSIPTPAPPTPTPGVSHPWVYSATITNGTISFRVEVSDLKTTVGAIEISGIATQVNGAFAPIYRIINIPDGPNGDKDDPQEVGRYFLDVEATPTADHPFRPDEDVTVFVRVSKVWVTVLGSGSGPRTVAAGPTWGIHRADSHVSAPVGEPTASVTLTPPA
jgi:hypothetical protein